MYYFLKANTCLKTWGPIFMSLLRIVVDLRGLAKCFHCDYFKTGTNCSRFSICRTKSRRENGAARSPALSYQYTF